MSELVDGKTHACARRVRSGCVRRIAHSNAVLRVNMRVEKNLFDS